MNIRVLLVDDDEKKRSRTVQVVRERLGDRNVEVVLASTAHDAAMQLEKCRFDLMVLDLNLPRRGREAPRKDGGQQLLRQVVKGGPRLKRPTHILGLTSFPELRGEFDREFVEEGWQLVEYDETSESWESTIGNKLVHIAEAVSASDGNHDYQRDLALLTALKQIELDAILDLDADWAEHHCSGDDTFYYTGAFERDGRRVTVVAAAAIEMGMAAAACLATKMIHHFRPRYLGMAGIAAGVDAQFGDIIIADQSWDYGSGKILTGSKQASLFAPAPNYIPIDAGLKEKATHFISSKREVLAAIPTRWRGKTPPNALSAIVGPVASGAAVVENEATVKAIREHNRKLKAIEMETYGVYLAARVCRGPRPAAFSAKAVCDFGTPPKTDEYQRYAAFTSANFIYEFSLDQLSRSDV